MKLSWNEIRVRAAQFSRRHRDAAHAKGETQTFYNEFFELFGTSRASVARYEERVARPDNSRGVIDLLPSASCAPGRGCVYAPQSDR